MIGSWMLVDKLGRRPILIWGMAGMAATLFSAGLTASFLLDSEEPGAAGNFAILMVVGSVLRRMQNH